MSKREKHDKKPHIVREKTAPAELQEEAPLDADQPKFGPAWLGEPRAVPDALAPPFHDQALEARVNYAATLAEIDRRTGRITCTTCGNPVKPGATCAVDGQIAPEE